MENLLNDLKEIEALAAMFQGVDLSLLEADAAAVGVASKALLASVAKLLNDAKAQLPPAQ